MADDSKSWTFIDKVEKQVLLLDDSDICYYYLVRTSGGYNASDANSRIDNFKKKPEEWRNNQPVWRHKTAAINRFVDDVCALLDKVDFKLMLEHFSDVALIPIPTSIPKNHEHYDSRLVDMCFGVSSKNPSVYLEDAFDVREKITPVHEGGIRDVEYLKHKMLFNGFTRTPKLVLLLDDVLTKGTHYIACRDMIKEMYPDTQVIGLFLAIHRSDWVNYEVIGIDP